MLDALSPVASGGSASTRVVRLAVYVDDVYRREGNLISVGLAFPLFPAGLVDQLGAVTLLGRLDPVPGRAHHVVPRDVEFVPLPHYADLSRPFEVARGTAEALRQFWRVLGRVDAIWLLGPHPLGLVVALLATVRRRRVVLGVRQNTVEYAAHRHPGERLPQLAFNFLERAWRLLARVFPVVVVGPELVGLYSRAPRMLDLTISFVGEDDIVPAEVSARRDYCHEVRVLTVGRIDPEKNPLLLADILATLTADGQNVRLVVCGDGAMAEQLAERLDALGVADRAELLGYVPVDGALKEIYASSHVFLHVSWTEGVPQVLFEAFAARLPTVATDVGGVAASAGTAALLVPPGDAEAAAAAVNRIVSDLRLRERLVDAGVERVRAHARDQQLRRLASWLREVVER
jgi:glycosyltransferase involved in cell wall biosynthesis